MRPIIFTFPADLSAAAAAAYHQQQSAAVASSPAPLSSPIEFGSLDAYPIMWHGHLGLKSDMATVQFHYLTGSRDLARASLPELTSTLKIGQRMRLEDNQPTSPSQLCWHRSLTQYLLYQVLLATNLNKTKIFHPPRSREHCWIV